MTVFEALQQSEVQVLRKRYHELTGYWTGYHWEEFGSVEEFKAYLRKAIAEEERKLEKECHD